MKGKYITLICIFSVISYAMSGCSSREDSKYKNDKIVIDGLPKEGVVMVGTKEQVSGAKKDAKELIDPANDYAMEARRLYKQKQYDQAEQEALKAIMEAKHNIVRLSGHNTLLDIYEVTKKYALAIKEIDWLLSNVNEHAKPELLKKKADLEKLL